MIPPKRLDIFPRSMGCSEGLDAFRVFPRSMRCSEGLDAFRVTLVINGLLVVVVVVVVSHIQRIGCQPEKTKKNYFTRWSIPLVVC